jgi:hypothetical protein
VTPRKPTPRLKPPSPQVPLCLNCQHDIEHEHGEADADCASCNQLRAAWARGWNAATQWNTRAKP